MEDMYRRNPARTHNPDKKAGCAGRNEFSKYVTVPCRMLLVQNDGYFSGGASIRAKCQSKVIGWRDLFYMQSVPKKIIIPIKKEKEQIEFGKASISYNGSITDVLGQSEQRKLKLLTGKIRELLKTEELEQREISQNLIWTLKKEFNESYLEMALQSKTPVLYSNLELKLPLL
ncbi:MAG: hypothetical protein QW666_00020 [Candidatus Woesearchaeota archaeon]